MSAHTKELYEMQNEYVTRFVRERGPVTLWGGESGKILVASEGRGGMPEDSEAEGSGDTVAEAVNDGDLFDT